MVKLSSVRTDHAKESGIWAEYGAGMRFKIARWNSPRVQRYFDDLKRSHRAEMVDPTSESSQRCIQSLIRKTVTNRVLVDWDEVDDEDGNAVVFSHETASQTLDEPSYFTVLDFILSVSQNEASYRVQADEADLGNS